MVKVLKGIYKSATNGDCEAVWVEISHSTGQGIADFNGTPYSFYSRSDFMEKIEMVEKETSKVFPKVTDFFNQELSEMTIKFKA
jgi:hypothetical protein